MQAPNIHDKTFLLFIAGGARTDTIDKRLTVPVSSIEQDEN